MQISSVQPFSKIILCDEETPHVKVKVRARILEGCLSISGLDFGEVAEVFFGDDEYEYFYEFDKENTTRLFALLTPEDQNINEMLVRKFGGLDGCRFLREFCDENSIKYDFFSC